MADEQACLVAPHSDSESSGFGACKMAYTERRDEEPQPLDTSLNQLDADSGELIDLGDKGVLAQFHEEALKQAGCGASQIRLLLAVGLAVCGATVEHSVLPFILTSAEIELCVESNEKSWLGMINLLGLCAGAAWWGGLADRLGRRRALVSCLAVDLVFSAIAAFMPTYGTFMMARFSSAVGSGGIIPTVYSYVSEHCARAWRPRALAALPLCAGAGCLYAAGVAAAVVPHSGEEAVIESRDHFSAWHRYLLLCTLPILASLISLIWLDESPRYLLQMGREVEALHIYQSIHSGKAAPAPGSDYRLGELEAKRAPPRPRASAMHDARHTINTFFQAFAQLFSSQYAAITFTLTGALFFTMTINYAISAYVPAAVAQMEADDYLAARRTISNQTFVGERYTKTVENVEYSRSKFLDCTFEEMFLTHVTFKNCTFENVTFANVKTSVTWFNATSFINCSILESQITPGRELDAQCSLRHSTLRGMLTACERRPDVAVDLRAPLRAQRLAAAAHALVAPAALLPYSMRAAPVVLFGVCLLTPALYFVVSETALLVLEAAFKCLLALAQFTLFLHIVEAYPTHLRCTAHGLALSLAHAGGMAAAALFAGLAPHGYAAAALLAAALGVLATAFALKTTRTADNLL